MPQSTQSYFSPTGSIAGTREGMELLDARVAYAPPANAAGYYGGAELARQSNRIAYFSGDDPATPTYERWDPLLSGGNGEQWVQGINHYRVVQDSNVIAHRLQARLAVAPRVELVPQLWAFYADSLNNIGGNPALTYLQDNEYGYEANITVKWFASRNLYLHGDIAYTVPGEAVQAALGDQAKNWFSAMVFLRYAF